MWLPLLPCLEWVEPNLWDLSDPKWSQHFGYLYKAATAASATAAAETAVSGAVTDVLLVTGRWPAGDPPSLCLKGAAPLPCRKHLGWAGQRDVREEGGRSSTAGGGVDDHWTNGSGCDLGGKVEKHWVTVIQHEAGHSDREQRRTKSRAVEKKTIADWQQCSQLWNAIYEQMFPANSKSSGSTGKRKPFSTTIDSVCICWPSFYNSTKFPPQKKSTVFTGTKEAR